MTKTPLDKQRRDLANIRSMIVNGVTPKPSERALHLAALDAIDETLAFNERNKAEFRIWYREKHGKDAQ